jgi:hypothetical protein
MHPLTSHQRAHSEGLQVPSTPAARQKKWVSKDLPNCYSIDPGLRTVFSSITDDIPSYPKTLTSPRKLTESWTTTCNDQQWLDSQTQHAPLSTNHHLPILDIVTQTSENSEPSERHANGAESEVEVRKKAYCSCTWLRRQEGIMFKPRQSKITDLQTKSSSLSAMLS